MDKKASQMTADKPLLKNTRRPPLLADGTYAANQKEWHAAMRSNDLRPMQATKSEEPFCPSMWILQ